ncbi:MAG TPA: hypothetical protein VE270_11845 [Thermoleophilaceae bacterium]|nr:hypothetical protein [Thermoleophilaceae bacterium]
MPFVGYVHARDPDPDPQERPAWEPEWRLWRWVLAALVLAAAASITQGLVSLVLVLAVFVLGCRAAVEALPNGDGLREHRQ